MQNTLRLQRAGCHANVQNTLFLGIRVSTSGRAQHHAAHSRQTKLVVRATSVTDPVDEMELTDEKRDIQKMLSRPYKYGFKTIIESETFPKGLNEDVVRAISAKKGEPAWMLEFRLKAFRKWLTMADPKWSDNKYPEIDFQDLSYYSEPKIKEKKKSLDEVDPELLKTFDKLGIPLNEQKRLANVAVDAVFDSVSIATTFREDLAKHGVIFCSISEAIKEYPDLVRKYMGSVVRVLTHPIHHHHSGYPSLYLHAKLWHYLFPCFKPAFMP